MGWIFNLVCPGNAMSASHNTLLLLKNATVNRNLGFDDVCKEKYVIVAYNNEGPTFKVSNITGSARGSDDVTGEKMDITVSKGEMVEYPLRGFVNYYNLAHEWEIQAAFFATNNIKPIWLNANYSWGWLNDTTGLWSGACGMIQRDEADYAIWGFSHTYARSKIAAFSATNYRPMHWLTRYPKELAPTWNLFGLFTKG